MLRSSRLILLVTALIVVAAVPAAHAKATLGISDNKPSIFGDAGFKDLKLKSVRFVAPWDALSYAVDRENMDNWIAGAKAAKQSVLLTFDRSRHGRKNPTPKALVKSFKAMRQRYPGQIAWVSTWNEVNLNEKAKPPKRVAQWYKELRKSGFPKSKILAADVVDLPNLGDWAKRFLAETRKQKIPTPKFWGLHNYVDANNFTDRRTKAFLKIVKGNVWLTETGGVVERNNGSKQRFRGKGAQHAADVTSFLLSTMLKRNRRLKAVFIYHWSSDLPSDIASWDSSLQSSTGVLRPAYNVVYTYQTGKALPAPGTTTTP
jgi:hypothetical protein